MFSIIRLNVKQFTYCLPNKSVIAKFYAFYAETLLIQLHTNSRDMGQMMHNYKRVVKGLVCTIFPMFPSLVTPSTSKFIDYIIPIINPSSPKSIFR